jgi:general stress protein YciG
MDPEKQREIAKRGGRNAHIKGTAHEWTSAEAAAAGRKGGASTQRKRAAQDAALIEQMEANGDRKGKK